MNEIEMMANHLINSVLHDDSQRVMFRPRSSGKTIANRMFYEWLENEYQLIQQKKSNLSANKRRKVVAKCESLQKHMNLNRELAEIQRSARLMYGDNNTD